MTIKARSLHSSSRATGFPGIQKKKNAKFKRAPVMKYIFNKIVDTQYLIQN